MDVHSVLRCVVLTQRSTECTSVAWHSSQHNITQRGMLPQHPNLYKEICNSRKKIETKWNIVETVAGRKPVNNDNHLFSLLHRAYCRVIQLLYQLMHIYKIYTLKY